MSLGINLEGKKDTEKKKKQKNTDQIEYQNFKDYQFNLLEIPTNVINLLVLVESLKSFIEQGGFSTVDGTGPITKLRLGTLLIICSNFFSSSSLLKNQLYSKD